MSASESTPGGELAEFWRRVADLRSGFSKPLSVLVPLVDLMLLEAEDRQLPLAVLEDLATLRRHLERLSRAAEAVASVDEPDGGAIEPESTGLELSILRGIVESHGGTLELRSQAGAGKTWIVLLPGRNGHRADP
jgi:hypothetical protein